MNLIKKVLQFSTNKPIIIIIITILISVILLPGIFRLRLDNDIMGYFNSDDEAYLTYEYIRKVFNTADASIFISIEADNIYSTETLNYVYELHSKLEKFKNDTEDKIADEKSSQKGVIKRITSIINIEDMKSENNVLIPYSLIEKNNGKAIIPASDKDLEELRKKIESNNSFKAYIVSNVVNEKGTPKALNILIELNKNNDYDSILYQIEDIVDKTKTPNQNTKPYIYGDIYNNREMNAISRSDAERQAALVVIVICLVYFLNFRSGIGVFFPLLVNALTTYWIFCLMGYFDVKVSLVIMLILPLLVAVTSSYGIHVLNQYYRESSTYTPENKKERIADSMAHILRTIILAGITTAIGVLSLVTSNVVHLRNFGIFAGIGVILSIILAVVFVPSMLSLVKIPKKVKAEKFNNTLFDRIMNRVILFTVQHKLIFFIVLIVIIIASVVGTSLISTDISTSDMFVKGHRVRFLTDYFSENFDGVSDIKLIIDSNADSETSIKNIIKNTVNSNLKKENQNLIDKSNNQSNETDPFFTDVFDRETIIEEQDPFFTDVFDRETIIEEQDPFFTDVFDGEAMPEKQYDSFENLNFTRTNGMATKSEFLKKVDSLTEYAKSLEGIGRSYSFADLIKRFHFIMNNNDPKYEIIPENDETIAGYLELFNGVDNNNNGLADDFEPLIDPDLNKICITMKLKNVNNRFINTGDYKRIMDSLSKYIEKNFDTTRIHYYISGTAILSMTVQKNILYGQVFSIGFSLLIIFVLIAILFKSAKVGLVSLIPLSIAVMVNFGVMGFSGIALGVETSLITAFAIGIGIDDTIHFLLNLKKEMKETNNKNRSLENIIYTVLVNTKKSIIFTSLALIFGFMVIVLSSFIQIRYFSLLVSLTMLTSTISTLIFLPTTILLFPRLIKQSERKPFVFKNPFKIKKKVVCPET